MLVDEDTKYFWKNYLQYLAIIITAIFLIGAGLHVEGPDFSTTGEKLRDGYLVISFFAILYLGYFIAKDISGKDKKR